MRLPCAQVRQRTSLHRAVRPSNQLVHREDLRVPLVLDGVRGCHVCHWIHHVVCQDDHDRRQEKLRVEPPEGICNEARI